MKLASIEIVKEVIKHPNADQLSIVKVLGYDCIVKLDQFKAGEMIVYIRPDTVLPEVSWTAFYRAKSNRVKAIKLRKVWSEGIVEKLDILTFPGDIKYTSVSEGTDVSGLLGVIKYEPPVPQELNAKGALPFGLSPTDEERYQEILDIPYGEKVDVTLKIDGQSFTAYRNTDQDGTITYGVCGRRLEFKLDCTNNYTVNAKRLDVLGKLESATYENIAIRGEQYGTGIQSAANNPHSKLPLGLAFFSVYLIDKHEYACKGHPFYAYTWIPTLGLPTVPVVEQDVILTPELVKKYAEDLETIAGVPFEGVVINHSKGSFKVINKHYDAKK